MKVSLTASPGTRIMSLISRMPTPFMTSLRQISVSPSVLKSTPAIEMPKKPSTPWVQYFQAKMPEFKKNYPDMRQPDVMRKISESWAQVNEKEKEKFQFIYAKQKEIYQQKIAKLSEDVISSNKATKAQKRVTKSKKSAADELKQLLEETKKPKKPLTAYLLFSMDCRPKLPNTMSSQEKLKKIGNDWQNASDSVKDDYLAKQKANLDRFQTDLTAWNLRVEKMGYADKIAALQAKVSMLKKKSKEL